MDKTDKDGERIALAQDAEHIQRQHVGGAFPDGIDLFNRDDRAGRHERSTKTCDDASARLARTNESRKLRAARISSMNPWRLRGEPPHPQTPSDWFAVSSHPRNCDETHGPYQSAEGLDPLCGHPDGMLGDVELHRPIHTCRAPSASQASRVVDGHQHLPDR